MDISSSCTSEYADEGRVLEVLLDLFSSAFSLEEIASAYCKAGRDANAAADILYEFQGSTCRAAAHASNGELRGSKLAQVSSDNISEKLACANKNSKASKPKKLSVSTGTVSSVIGKGYARPTTVPNGRCDVTKPLKLNTKELPKPEHWEEVSLDFAARNDPMHKDLEDFLFKMLGDGFKLDINVIRQVLGSCGYDVKKSMEKLLDISASTLDKSDDFGDSIENFSGKCPKPESVLCPEKPQHMDFDQSDETTGLNMYGIESSNQEKESDLPNEVLQSLFNMPERHEDIRRTRPVRAVKRTRPVCHTVVVEPPRDTTTEHLTEIVEPQQNIEDDEDDSYQVLRKAVKEHWVTMKEYYKTAVDAFAKGDHARAYELLEQGQFFNNKAREADEKSAQKILEFRHKETQDEVPLDLHDYDAKDAIRLLKFHLISISGIPDIRYLKVIVENSAKDVSKGSRKRLVMKLLEKESIKWTEEENQIGTILIRVDEINPDKLSFAKKPE